MCEKFSEFLVVNIKGFFYRFYLFFFIGFGQVRNGVRIFFIDVLDLLFIFLLSRLKFSAETKKAVFDELLLMRYDGKFNYPSNPKGYDGNTKTNEKRV